MKETKLAAIALGSNMGDSLETLRQAARDLADLGEITAHSSLYQTDPVGGPEGQNVFLNAVILLEPNKELLNPERLLDALLTLEEKHGRERRVRWGPRTLDLDLLVIGTQVWNSERLILPHPRMMERPFVLAPLCEVWPTLRHLGSGQPFCEILANMDMSGLIRTNLSW